LPHKRIAVTGMAINTPLGDTAEQFLAGLLAGKSAITRWKTLDVSRIYTKIGGDMSDYDISAKLASLEKTLSPELHRRLRRLISRIPWSAKIAVLLALEGYLDAGLPDAGYDPARVATIVAGHNLNNNYSFYNFGAFLDEPDYIDPLGAIHALDTNHVGCITELLKVQGPAYTVGGACASGNVGLRCAVDEIRYHGIDAVLLCGAVLEFSPIELHAMALIGAVPVKSFDETPELASRPFDTRREGFVPSHGGGVLVLEDLEKARARGARIYAEIIGVDANSDANHLPQPSQEGQSRLALKLLEDCGIAPEQINYVNAHATSTPLGDVVEVRSIKQVFGAHSKNLKVNAPKSMLGHTCWAAPVVETIAGILQMNAGKFHPSINIETLDPEVDLDVCTDGMVEYDIEYFMKNSFGFGGINSISILKRYDG
jgi:3-oxoacyl-(acyl-carrier-protein) synthase